ncbi:MAG: alpha-hydroxy-acid oxidizing protein [Candidatus Coatesbacteria bacterium]|nr:alpha-hydroxy-acid oxidizing protein [Candidatus Coatesbacteria bacterium]
MIIGAGILQLPAIRLAKEMGLITMVSDMNPRAIGMRYADIPLIVSTRDIEGTVRAARDYATHRKIDGVITVGTDASRTVAAVANALGLPGNKFETAEVSTNKIKMRRRFLEHNVPSPNFRGVWTLQEAHRAAEQLGSWPLVMKPSDNMGARGVMQVDSMEIIPEAFHRAKEASPSGELIIEEFMDGPELSIDALVFDDEVRFVGIADRIIGYPPYFVELGHTMPSTLPQDKIDEACEVMRRGIAALGLTVGAAKGDIKVTSKGVMIGELASRLSGGFMSSHTYPLSTGVSSIKAALEIALGMNPTDLEPKFSKVAAERAVFCEPGQVRRISGIDAAQKAEGVVDVVVHVRPGDYVHPPTCNLDKPMNIITIADTREEAVRLNDQARDMISVEIGKPVKLTHKLLRDNARKLFGLVCRACEVCDGKDCPTGVPGMGAVGTGDSFRANLDALRDYKINVRSIHSVKKADTSCELFGTSMSCPVLAAPLTGTNLNMGGALTEEEYAKIVVSGCKKAGTIGVVGDGALPKMYHAGLSAIAECGGFGIPIFKPRAKLEDIVERLDAAAKVNCIAVGIDVDAAAFLTMDLMQQAVETKSVKQLREIVSATDLPFIVKGVMTVWDAVAAVEAGAAAIIVSNHGGRVLDNMPGALHVLSDIVSVVKDKVTILVDGGIRSGADVLKCIALGADAVLIGRPISVAAFGAGIEGVEFYMNSIRRELENSMILTGCATIADIGRDVICRT